MVDNTGLKDRNARKAHCMQHFVAQVGIIVFYQRMHISDTLSQQHLIIKECTVFQQWTPRLHVECIVNPQSYFIYKKLMYRTHNPFPSLASINTRDILTNIQDSESLCPLALYLKRISLSTTYLYTASTINNHGCISPFDTFRAKSREKSPS